MDEAQRQLNADTGLLLSFAADCERNGSKNDAASLRRIAAALNQRAGVVEALEWIARVNATEAEYQKVARAALAAIKEKDRG
jgi:hypothetical protein